jgi:hypothetical protein
MRKKILMTAAAAFLLSTMTVATSPALAQVKPSEVKKNSEHKDPAVADAADAKSEKKDAKKEAKVATKKAKTAEKKAKVASKKADTAAKDAAAAK